MPYIDIVRHFRDLGTDPLPPATRRMLRGLKSPLTWKELLDEGDRRHLVLVASSGLGKSTELAAQANRVRAAGRHAVRCAARDLVSEGGIEQALEAEELAALRGWQTTDDRAVIFVDGVDELVLAQRDFGSLLRRLASMLGSRVDDCQLVLTARGGWSPRHATALVERLLRTDDTNRLREITFEPLDGEAIERLADAAGCSRLPDFMAAFHADEVDATVDLRPMDVEPIVARWNTRGEIGSWSQILQDYVDTAAYETNPERDFQRELTLQDVRVAARRTGTANVMMKNAFISLPQEAVGSGTIAARLLFADWAWQPLSELVATPLFVHKGAATVQLPQGPLPPYLAARWFAERWRRGRSTEWLRDQLLVRVFGEERFVIPASRRETVGWLASFVPDFRSLLEEVPEVVLYEGDPENLSDEEIVHWLSLLAGKMRPTGIDPWPSRGTVRRLARPGEVQAKVVDMLAFESAPVVQMALLNWAAVGRYSTALPRALALALDGAVDVSVRTAAVRAVVACEDDSARDDLRALVNEDDEHLRTELLGALVPHTLAGKDLVDFIVAGGGDSFAYNLGTIAKHISVSDLSAILARLLPAVASPTITPESVRQSELAGPVLIARIRQPPPYPDVVVQTVLAFEANAGDGSRHLHEDDAQELEELLARDPELRRALWLARLQVDESDDTRMALFHARFGHGNRDDLPWLFALGTERPELAPNIGSTLRQILGSLSDEERAQLVQDATLEDGLRTIVEADHASRRQLDETREAHARDKDRQAAETRRENTENLQTRREAIRRSEDLDALQWAWGHLGGRGNRRELNFKRLAQVIEDDLISDFVHGYKALWRRQEVELPDPDDRSILVRVVAGLGGLTLEAADGLDFATLTPDEAGRAARYALYELNGFPEWFSDLLDAHEPVVRAVLSAAIEREWRSSSDSLTILRYAPYAREREAVVLRDIALQLLDRDAPATAHTLHSAINAVLLSSDGVEPVLRTARSGAAGHEDASDPRLAEWLRGWAHLAPDEAATWFEGRLAADVKAAEKLLIEVAALLEKDFDHAGSPVAASRLMSPTALERWIALLFGRVRPDDDIRADGFLGSRHHAQDFRHRCLSQLSNDPSPSARAALTRVTGHPSFAGLATYATRLLRHQHRVAAEAAATPWTEGDLVAVERGDERPPRSLDELFALVRSHLVDVARVVETDDFSYRDLFPTDTDERRIQLWAASTLRQRSRGLYEVVRENVVDDDKEVDITAAAAGVGQVPIEIKPAARGYSASDLESTIEDQLIGRYMTQHDRTMGILLLVRHRPKRWRIDGTMRDFSYLAEHLRKHGRAIGSAHGKTIAVATIDIESNRTTKTHKKKATKKKATKKK